MLSHVSTLFYHHKRLSNVWYIQQPLSAISLSNLFHFSLSVVGAPCTHKPHFLLQDEAVKNSSTHILL